MTLYKNIKMKYNKNTNNIIHNYSKHNKKLSKLKSSTTFLIKCKQVGIIPKFIINATKTIYNIFKINGKIPTYLSKVLEKHIYNFHIIILNMCIQQKHRQTNDSKKQIEKTTTQMSKLLEEQDFKLLMESERVFYDNNNNNYKNAHIKKLQTLKDEHNKENKTIKNENWFINTTDKTIPTNVEWLLSLGPKHALPTTTTTFPLFKCIADGEDMVQTIENKETQEIARNKLTQVIGNYLQKSKPTQKEKFTLDVVRQTKRFLDINNDLLILSADKGNKTVAMNKIEYEGKMKDILGDFCMYKRLKKDPTVILQTKNNALIEKLFNLKIINIREKYNLINKTALAPRIYGLPKIHKIGTPLRPICSSINSPAYGLCKYIINILKNLTKSSKYNVKDAIDFKTKINNTKIEKDETFISFDVISLFPSIPVNFALKTIEGKWSELEKFTNIPKQLFMEILTFCIKETRYFKYDKYIYEQRKGMPMGSPASPVIADIVMEEVLDYAINMMKSKPKILTKYVDDIFAIIKVNEVEETLRILNSYSNQIQFTKEEVAEDKLPYLDSLVIRKGDILKLNWYKKPTSSGRLINFYSKHPRKVIINTATNFIRRVLEISDKEFHRENIIRITETLIQNEFPLKTIKDLIKYVVEKNNGDNKETEKEKIYKSTTYVPDLSERIKYSNIYDKDKYELAFKTSNTVNKLFSKTKTKIEKEEKSNLVYEIGCNGDGHTVCEKLYVGTTKTKLKTRLSSHRSDQKAINKPLEQKTALSAHCTLKGHTPNFERTRILQEENNYNKRFMLEMLHIINVPAEKRLNYKRDTENCAQIYRNVVDKHTRLKQKLVDNSLRNS